MNTQQNIFAVIKFCFVHLCLQFFPMKSIGDVLGVFICFLLYLSLEDFSIKVALRESNEMVDAEKEKTTTPKGNICCQTDTQQYGNHEPSQFDAKKEPTSTATQQKKQNGSPVTNTTIPELIRKDDTCVSKIDLQEKLTKKFEGFSFLILFL